MKFILLLFAGLSLSFFANAQCSANAGPDLSACGNTLTITGSISYNIGSSALWSTSISGVIFSDPSNIECQITVNSMAQNIAIPIILTETNASLSCNSTDTMVLIFNNIQAAMPLVDEADSINCGLSLERLNAQYPAHGYGYWFDDVANTTFYPSASVTTPDSVVISPSAYGMHSFFWVTVNGICRDTSEVVPFRYIENPIANAVGSLNPELYGTNSFIKTDTSSGLSYMLDAIPSIGTGLWFNLEGFNTNISSYNVSGPHSTLVNFNNYTNNLYERFVWVEDNQSCTDKDTLFLWVHPAPAGISIINNPSVTIYPNPWNNKATINIDQNPITNTFFSIKNIAGQCLMSQTMSEKTCSIDLTEYENGIYIISISIDNEVEYFKLVKQD